MMLRKNGGGESELGEHLISNGELRNEKGDETVGYGMVMKGGSGGIGRM